MFVSGGYYSFGVDVWSLACIMAELMRCLCIACESDQHEVYFARYARRCIRWLKLVLGCQHGGAVP